MLDANLRRAVGASETRNLYALIRPMGANAKVAAVVAKHDGVGVSEPLGQIVGLLKARGYVVRADDRTAGFSPVGADAVFPREPLDNLLDGTDLAVVVGGDGTLLGCARVAARHDVPVIGVNLGHLGFLTDLSADSVTETLGAVLDGKFTRESRILLEGEIERAGETIFRSVALNDVVVSRGAMGSMIEISIEVDGEFVYSARADGLIVATPTGSTAYALSSGGPILHPSLPAISLVPISPHTLSNRPIAIASTSVVKIRLLHGKNARVNFDVQAFFDPATDDVITVRAHPRPLTLLHPEGHSYFAVLRNKLHWNERTS
jgi:NAD+ kinase